MTRNFQADLRRKCNGDNLGDRSETGWEQGSRTRNGSTDRSIRNARSFLWVFSRGSPIFVALPLGVLNCGRVGRILFSDVTVLRKMHLTVCKCMHSVLCCDQIALSLGFLLQDYSRDIYIIIYSRTRRNIYSESCGSEGLNRIWSWMIIGMEAGNNEVVYIHAYIGGISG